LGLCWPDNLPQSSRRRALCRDNVGGIWAISTERDSIWKGWLGAQSGADVALVISLFFREITGNLPSL
jgi:hypothetical protein